MSDERTVEELVQDLPDERERTRQRKPKST
jgi:hypothetical protein